MLFGLGEFLGVWAWGLFFCGMNGGRDERTVCQRGGHRRCVGCGWGEFFAVCREGIGE